MHSVSAWVIALVRIPNNTSGSSANFFHHGGLSRTGLMVHPPTIPPVHPIADGAERPKAAALRCSSGSPPPGAAWERSIPRPAAPAAFPATARALGRRSAEVIGCNGGPLHRLTISRQLAWPLRL